MKIEDITPEQFEKFKACKTSDEIMELIQEEGLELSDEDLESIAGGKLFDVDWADVDPEAFFNYFFRRNPHMSFFV